MKRQLKLGLFLVFITIVLATSCSSTYRTTGDRTKCGCPSVR